LNLRNRVRNFVNAVQNMRVTDVLPDHIEKYLATRNVSADTKDADCRAVSSFFTWCMKGKRHWAVNNSCFAVEIEGASDDDAHEPVVLPVTDCERLLRAAEAFGNGRLVPYPTSAPSPMAGAPAPAPQYAPRMPYAPGASPSQGRAVYAPAPQPAYYQQSALALVAQQPYPQPAPVASLWSPKPS
jgi:hypothetical protein